MTKGKCQKCGYEGSVFTIDFEDSKEKGSLCYKCVIGYLTYSMGDCKDEESILQAFCDVMNAAEMAGMDTEVLLQSAMEEWQRVHGGK
jgi:hypothetical protein